MFGQEHLQAIWESLIKLGTKRLIALAAVGVTTFGVIGFGSYYLSRPELETLYAGLNAQDVSRIGAALKEAGISFDVNAEGSKVLVRHSQTAQARMLLAEKGLPSSANAGYELFDKLGSMGLTSFMQEITRVRALEGEIARTIQAVKGVKAARVHIVLPDAGSFRRGRQTPSASVVIRTESANDFSSAPAIRHLVAAAVPGMAIDQVSVLSTEGAVLAAGGDTSNTAPVKLAGLEKTISTELQDNVRKTLAPYLGLENFEISVAARLNTDKRQINETAFDPESRVERSVRVVKESGASQNVNNRAAVGVEQNIPAEQTQTQSGEQSKRQNERREELTNYELNSKSISTVSEGYKIENLAIAVVVNRKRIVSALGEAATAEAIDAQLKEIERLVGSAAGADAKRGDRITVAAVDFFHGGQSLEPMPGPSTIELLLRHAGSAMNIVAVLAGGFLLIQYGLRPALKAIIALPQSPPAAAIASVEAQPKTLAGPGERLDRQPEPEPNLIADLTAKLGRTPQKRLEQMVDFDEEQAAAILRQWLHGARGSA